MKKIICAALSLFVGVNIANAKPVTPATAKTVAQNFYAQNSTIVVNNITLAYTELSVDGLPVYYVFDINVNDGFVIVAAEDALKPIMGYSTKKHFVTKESSSPSFNYWMKGKTTEVNSARTQNAVAIEKVSAEWTGYINNTITNPYLNQRLSGGGNSVTTGNAVLPLMLSTWNQSPGYNSMCPGTGSNQAVTGCVATTMAQIMRYWSYPATGSITSTYCDCTADGYKDNNGTLSANYGATTYDWANMPYGTSNTDIAQLMFQCGVSVDMDYDPSGSAAQVLAYSSTSACAQNSYKRYFKYDPTQIRGISLSSFTSAGWLDTIESDLNIGRCVQYVGVDPSQGGHTWVCDGYDVNDNLHMNWGWGGDDDGYFTLGNFLTTNDGFNPSSDNQALLGIVPISTNGVDAGVPAIASPLAYYCSSTTSINPSITLQNFGTTTLTSCTINYSINGVAQTPQNWTGSLVSYQSATISLPTFSTSIGTYTLICASSNPNSSTDQNPANDADTIVYSVAGNGVLPVIEGFETSSCPSGTLPNVNWNISHSTTGGTDFAITSSAAASGSNSAILNNINNVDGNNSILQTTSSFDLSTFNTPSLTFEAAYQQKATTNADKLQVFTSTDCGNSWVSRKVITATTLASLAGGVSSTPYVPTSAQFTTYTVTITAVANNPTVMFRWEFLADPNGPGNNLYIDNINLVDAAPLGIQNIETKIDLNMYPNPSSGTVNINFNLSEQHSVSVNVTDILGRTVETIGSKSYQSGETTLTIGNDKAYQAGIYLVNITIDGQHIAKKIIIQ